MANTIKITRNLMEHEVWLDAPLLRTMIWCILSAAESKSKQFDIQFNRGQFVTTKLLAKEQLNCTDQEFRFHLERLVAAKVIECKPTNGVLLITVLNYSKYQGDNTKVKVAKEETIAAEFKPFPCNGTTKEWVVTEEKIQEWITTFPGVEVRVQIRKAWQWIKDNDSKRKTARGMPAFLNRWLSNAQDTGKGKVVKSPYKNLAEFLE